MGEMAGGKEGVVAICVSFFFSFVVQLFSKGLRTLLFVILLLMVKQKYVKRISVQ